MFKELLQKLAQKGCKVAVDCSCLVVIDTKTNKELAVISTNDRNRDAKLRNCYYSL